MELKLDFGGLWSRLAIAVAGAAAAAASVAVALVVTKAARSERDTEPQPIPPPELPRLTAAVGKVAAAYGDRSPRDITAVATTHDRAMAVVAPGDYSGQDSTGPVYLIVMRGQFTALASPSGVRAPTGSYLSVVLDRQTLAITDRGISSRPPAVPLDSLGTVVHLAPAAVAPAHP